MPENVSPRLIVISGPIASGKSTIAAAMSAVARRRGLTVALTGLDVVAEMALPTLPNWDWAHRVHAQLVGAWLATDVELVIDEGTSSRYEVGLVLGQVPATTEVGHVVLTANLDRSLERAQGDPGRGASAEADFLRADHTHYAGEWPHLLWDLRIDVEGRTPKDMAAEVLDHFGI